MRKEKNKYPKSGRKIKPGPPRITIRNRVPGKFMTGATTEVLMDGKPLKYLKSVKFEVAARGLAVFTFEMFADLDIEGKSGVDALKVLQRNVRHYADEHGRFQQLGTLEMDYIPYHRKKPVVWKKALK